MNTTTPYQANTFLQQDTQSRAVRDRLFAPLYRELAASPENMCFIDGAARDPHLSLWLQQKGVDTMLVARHGQMVSIDEKIRHSRYDDILLETESCTIAGREKKGWMYEGTATLLAYAFYCTQPSMYLDVYFIDFSALKHWFFGSTRDWKMIAPKYNREVNQTRSYPIPLPLIAQKVGFWHFKVFEESQRVTPVEFCMPSARRPSSVLLQDMFSGLGLPRVHPHAIELKKVSHISTARTRPTRKNDPRLQTGARS